MTPIRKIIALATTAIAAVALSACDVNAGVGIHENGTADLAMEFHDTDGLLGAQGLTSCDDIAKQISQEALKELPQGTGSKEDLDKVLDSLEISNVSRGDELGCSIKLTTPDSIIDGTVIKETDSTFVIDARNPAGAGEVPPEASLFTKMVDLKLVISTPGDIIKADGATIDGNRAIYTDIDGLMKNGIYIEGNKTGNDDFSDMLSSSSSTGGFPIWAWVLIGVVIVIVIAALIFFMVRKKPQANTMQTPAYGFTPQPNHPGQPVATNTPAPTARPSAIPTQNHSHTMPTPQSTPDAQPFAQMQRHLDHDVPNIPDSTQTPQAPTAPSSPLNPQTLEGDSSANGTNWNSSETDENQLS